MSTPSSSSSSSSSSSPSSSSSTSWEVWAVGNAWIHACKHSRARRETLGEFLFPRLRASIGESGRQNAHETVARARINKKKQPQKTEAFGALLATHSFQFIKFMLFISIHSCQFIHSFQFIHLSSLFWVLSCQFIRLNSLISIHLFQFIHLHVFH